MPIPRRLLAEDEEVLVDLRPHWVVLLSPALVTAAALVVAIGVVARFPAAPTAVLVLLALVVAVPACWLLARGARWWATSLVVTSARLVQRRGLLGRDVAQVRLARVADVHCRQTIWARLAGTGDLVVELAGGEPGWVVHDVRKPHRLQAIVSRQLDEVWERSEDRAHLSPPDDSLPRPTHPWGDPGAMRSARPGHGDRRPPSDRAPGGVGLWPPRPWGPPPPSATPPAGTGTSAPGHPLDAEPRTPPTGTEPVPLADPMRDRLVALHQLYQQGLVTREEYLAKRADLLDRL